MLMRCWISIEFSNSSVYKTVKRDQEVGIDYPGTYRNVSFLGISPTSYLIHTLVGPTWRHWKLRWSLVHTWCSGQNSYIFLKTVVLWRLPISPSDVSPKRIPKDSLQNKKRGTWISKIWEDIWIASTCWKQPMKKGIWLDPMGSAMPLFFLLSQSCNTC